ISRNLRALATNTSWPHSSKSRLTQGEWVPVSIAMRSEGSETKRRLRASGVVRSLPSSRTSPLCVSMRHRGRSTCRRDPIRLSPSVALCYHPWWADPPSYWAVRACILLADPKGTAYGGSAFSSHLPRTPQPVEKPLSARSEHPSRTQKPRHCSVLALMSKCLDAVLDYRLVLQRLFQQADKLEGRGRKRARPPRPPPSAQIASQTDVGSPLRPLATAGGRCWHRAGRRRCGWSPPPSAGLPWAPKIEHSS